MCAIDDKLKSLNISLASPTTPKGNYRPVIEHSGVLYIAGQFPFKDGKLIYKGKIGKDISREDGYQACRLCAINVLSQIRGYLGSWERFERMLLVEVGLFTTEDFTEHPSVANGASDLFVEVFGDRGLHARTVAGYASMAFGASAKILCKVAVKP